MTHWLRPTSLTSRGLIALAALLIAVVMHQHLAAAGKEVGASATAPVATSSTPVVVPSGLESSSAWTDAQTVEELLAQGSGSANPVPEPGTFNIIMGTLAVLSALGVARVMSNRF